MSEPKLNIKEKSSTKKTRSPPKRAKVEQSVPRKKKLKTDADKAAERAQHLRFGSIARVHPLFLFKYFFYTSKSDDITTFAFPLLFSGKFRKKNKIE